MKVDGTLQTGVARNADLTFDIDTTTVTGANGVVTGYITKTTRTGGFANVGVPSFETTGYASTVMARIQKLRTLEVAYAGTADAAGYASERDFLQEKLIGLGLARRDPDNANGILFGTTSAVGSVSPQSAAVAARTAQKTNQLTAEQTLATATTNYTTEATNKANLDSRATRLTALDSAVAAYNTQVALRNTALATYTSCRAPSPSPACGNELTSLNSANGTLATRGVAVNTAITSVNAVTITGIAGTYVTTVPTITPVTVSPGTTGAATATIAAL